VIKQLGLIELHCKDGSALEAGCQCIDTKHLFLIEGLAEEGQGFALSAKERQFYADLGNLVRATRKNMEVEDYRLPGSNPGLPHNLTECEKKRERCVIKLKKKPGAFVKFNPYAVCNASIKCPPGKLRLKLNVT